MISRDLAATVGRTPMVELESFARGLPGRVVAKLEMRNPCGSVKDRLGVELVEDETVSRRSVHPAFTGPLIVSAVPRDSRAARRLR